MKSLICSTRSKSYLPDGICYCLKLKNNKKNSSWEIQRLQKNPPWECGLISLINSYLVLYNDIARFFKDDITQRPAEVVYTHGLHLDGAGKGSQRLLTLKVLFTAIPVIHIYAQTRPLAEMPGGTSTRYTRNQGEQVWGMLHVWN